MIGAALLSFAGIVLLAAGTPRQAELLSRASLREPRRRALRVAGLILLALSFGAALAGGDQARAAILWIGLIGVEALAVALGFTWLGRVRGRNHAPARKEVEGRERSA